MSLIKLFLGRTKSGKSYQANKMLKKRSKAIVYDYAHCFTSGKVYSINVKNLSKLLRNHGGVKNKSKKYSLIFRKENSMSHQDALDLVALFAQKLGESYGVRALPENDLIAFVIDEVDKCSTKKDSDRVRLAVQAGRHQNLSTWAIAQRPTRVHPDIRANVTEIRAFPLAGGDRWYEDTLSKKAVEKLNNSDKKYSFLFWNDEGELKLINSKGGVDHDFNKE